MLLERLQQFAQDNELPENLTLEEAIHIYQANQCSLGKAAELAGVTRWQLQEILHQRGTPGVFDSDLTLNEIDDMVNLLETEYTVVSDSSLLNSSASINFSVTTSTKAL